MSPLSKDFLVSIVIDWLHYYDWLNSSTWQYNHHIPYIPCIYFSSFASLFSVISFKSKLVSGLVVSMAL